jgi:hypothetical protein
MPIIMGIASHIPKAAAYLALSLFVVALGLFTVNQFRLLYLAHTDPVTFHAMIIDPDVVAPGDPLYVTAVLTRHRYCRSERDHFIADVDTNTNQWQTKLANGSTTTGEVKIRNRYNIPVLPPAEYVFRSVFFYRCSDGDTHSIHGPEAKFRIVVP